MSVDQDKPLLGIMLMLVAMMMVPLLDLFAKLLSHDYPVLQVTWARFAFHTLWLLPLLLWQRLRWWCLPVKLGYQLIRSLLLIVTTLSFFIAIRDNPIPNALTLLFVSPLVVAMVAPFWLGESFDWQRGIAVLCGFLGILLVLQPTTNQFQYSLLPALVAGISYACYIMITRKLSHSVAPLLTLFYTAVVGFLILSPLAVSVWVKPDLQAVVMMAAMGFFAAVGHFMIIQACEYATASQLSPFNYFEIIGAVVISYLVFGYWPTIEVWVGVLVVSLSGFYISWREMRMVAKATLVDNFRADKL